MANASSISTSPSVSHLSTTASLAYATPAWRSKLAHDLRISTRTIYRWERGQSPIPPRVWQHLTQVMQRQVDVLLSARERELVTAIANIRPLCSPPRVTWGMGG
jgi:hypothetical protein